MPQVLLVEDEEPLRRILARNLSRRDYGVTETSTATDAIAALRTGGPFDVVLLDVNLPDRTGWDVLRAMKGLAVPPVIVLTALAPTPQRLKEFHPEAVLLKPFPIDAFVRLVGRVVGAQSSATAANGEAWA
jgi:DNA-binding response OmpR family regulator